MKIKSIDIETFGKFEENFKIEKLDSRINLIYGENEAGKSTLFNMFTTLFYGFYPSNREEHPYVNWNKDKISFEVVLSDIEHKDIVVKRTLKSKVQTEYFNGIETIKTNNQTLDFASHISRDIYEKVYSITADTLLMFKGKTWDDIQEKLLFNMGSEIFLSTRDVLSNIDKKCGEIWRPNRRGNQLIREMEKEIKELKKRKKNVIQSLEKVFELERTYETLKTNRYELENYLSELDSDIKSIKKWLPIKNILIRKEIYFGQLLDLSSFKIDLKENYLDYIKALKSDREIICNNIEEKEKEILKNETQKNSLSDEELEFLAKENEIYSLRTWCNELDHIKMLIVDLMKNKDKKISKLKNLAENIFENSTCEKIIEVLESLNRGTFLRDLNELRKYVQAFETLPLELGESKIKGKNVLSFIILCISSLLTAYGLINDIEVILYICLTIMGASLYQVVRSFIFKEDRSIDIKREQINDKISVIISTIENKFTNVDFNKDILKNFSEEHGIIVRKLYNEFDDLMEIEKNIIRINIEKNSIIHKIKSLYIVSNEEQDYKRLFLGISNRIELLKKQKNDIEIIEKECIMLKQQKKDLDIENKELTDKIDLIESELSKVGQGSIIKGVENLDSHINAQRHLKMLNEELIGKYTFDGSKEIGKQIEFELERASELNISDLESKRNLTHNELSETMVLMAEIFKDITKIKEEIQIDETESQINYLEKEKERLTLKRDKLVLMSEIIKIADEKFKLKNQPDVLKNASMYLAKMTRGKYYQIFIEKVNNIPILKIMVKDQSIPLDFTDTFSKGTQHQIFLALRLALISHLDEGRETLPIFLDETLVNWDENRLFPTLELISEFAENNQVFLFTCHNHFANIVEEKMKIKRIEIN